MVTITAQEYYELGMKLMRSYDGRSLLPALRAANSGALEDVQNTNGNAYYQWTAALVKELKPKQIVELGGAMGVWDICVLHELPQDSCLHSITLAEHGLEYSYVVDKYPNFFPVVGDDLDFTQWPKDLDFNKTDIFFIDTLHEEHQLRAELDLYLPKINEKTLVMFDDIYINDGMRRVWEDIVAGKYGKADTFDASDPLHWSGFGLAIYETKVV